MASRGKLKLQTSTELKHTSQKKVIRNKDESHRHIKMMVYI